MKQAIIDTNFIMTCVKQKIDFLEEINLMGILPLIPKEVIQELRNNKAELALSVLESENKLFKKIEIGTGHVDKKIIEYARKNTEIIVATLDKEIQKSIKNKKAVITERKRISIL